LKIITLKLLIWLTSGI